MGKFAIGVDYGTNSVRALLVDCADGREVAAAVFGYPSGTEGVVLSDDPNLARQHPRDYIDGFIDTVRSVVAQSGVAAEDVVGIGIDTTGSSPMPVDGNGLPLAWDFPQVESDYSDAGLAAMCWLWKDHTSYAEAAEITEKAASYPYLAKCGGVYSSEWFWSKILRCARVAPEVFDRAHSWVEIADFVPGYVTGTLGTSLRRGICPAGHKAMFATAWGGLPSEEFLVKLDPRLAALRSRLYSEATTSDQIAGGLTEVIAGMVGLRAGTPVMVGAFDAHLGAIGAGIRPGTLVKIMGTSTCDCMVHPSSDPLPDIPGLCGIVPGSVLPDMWGLEAGQSAVGDIFNWFVKELGTDGHEALTAEAATLKPGASGLLSLDWNNGNRTVLVDPRLSGLILGLSLHSTAAEIYRTLIESTAFGALKIIERIERYGVAVDEVVNCGGIAEKSPLTMQIYADVCNRPMKVSRSAQTCALGSAIVAAVGAGVYPNVEAAQSEMTGVKDRVYVPNPDAVTVYKRLNALYTDLHDAFGTKAWQGNLGHVMKELLDIRDRARRVEDDKIGA